MHRTELRLLAVTAAALTTATPWAARAAQPDPAETVDTLRSLSLEQLAQLPITSVAKRPEPLAEAAAAVFVINREDIRRSGATTLPEVLRLAPNLEVAQLNGYTWTISARGFNSPTASNKLLVLVDGRSVIEPVGSSVLWQQVDVMLDDIDRIEVVSGPGGALWGANAVNGVINIITRNAADSKGLLFDVSAGDFNQTAQLRYGVQLSENASLRVYAQGFHQQDTRASVSTDFDADAWRGAQGGFRFDGRIAGGVLTAQGDAYRNVIKEDTQGSLWGGDLQARFTRPLGDQQSIEALVYYSRDERTAPSLFERRDSWDLQLQHNIQANAQNAVVWGGEVRVWRETYASQDFLAFQTPTTDIVLGSVFAQDELSLTPRLKLTAGIKLEESSYSGFEWLPTVRVAWRYNDSGLLWGAISRSVRTPNRIERELVDPGVLEPSPKFESEKLTAYEAGWRGQLFKRASVSISGYYNVYDDLRTLDQVTNADGSTIIFTANGLRGQTAGLETWGKLEIVRSWRVSIGANILYKNFKPKFGHDDISSLEAAGQDPSYQAQIRSEANLTSWLEFDADVRAVGRYDVVHGSIADGAPAYVEGDARLAIRLARGVELSVNGRNLFNPRHLESVQSFEALPARYIGRTVFARLRWGF
jgi:iron complex outermembrane receptor protein